MTCKENGPLGTVRVPANGHRELRCALEGSPAAGMGSSGEGYQAVEFRSGTWKLTIGTEMRCPELEVIPMADGIVVTILGDVPEVVFGVIWVEYFAGDCDVRTWFAADPTLD